MYNMTLSNELIDEIGEFLGFDMWNTRDLTKEYGFSGCREPGELRADDYVSGEVICYKNILMLVYKNVGYFHGSKSLYTLNLYTIKPTSSSINKTVLSKQLIDKIKQLNIEKPINI